MANLFDPQETYDNTYQGQRDRRADHNAAMGLLGAKAPQAQNVGGFTVAPSATEQMAHALRQYSAMRQYNNTLPPTTTAAPAAAPTDSIGQTIAKQAAEALLKQQQAQQQSNTIGGGEY